MTFKRLLGVNRPQVSSRHDDPAAELFLARRSDEGVDVLLSQSGRGRITLALEERAVDIHRDQVHPDIHASAVGPVRPQPHFRELLAKRSVGLQCVEHQPLEPNTLVVLVGGDRTDRGKHLLNLRRRAQHSTRQMAGRPKPCGHRRFPAKGWSIYGAQRAQPVAIGGKWDALENRSNRPIRNRWQPTATVSQRMVKVDHLLAKRGGHLCGSADEIVSCEPEAARRDRRVTIGRTGRVVGEPGTWFATGDQAGWCCRDQSVELTVRFVCPSSIRWPSGSRR
jgi:hypothetical protein